MPLYTTYTDEALFQLLRKGNLPAFNEIYRRYWKVMYALAEKKLNNPYDAEEIIQDIFIDLWNQKDKIELIHSLKSYLAGMVKFKVYAKLAFYYKQRKVAAALLSISRENVFLGFSTEENFRLKELKTKILKTVNSLPERCRLIYTLSREEGLSHKQIATLLHISQKTIETQIYRALQRLRSALQCLLFLLLL